MFNVCVMCKCRHFAVEHELESAEYSDARKCRICDCRQFAELDMQEVTKTTSDLVSAETDEEEDDEEYEPSEDEQRSFLIQQLVHDQAAWENFRLEVKLARLAHAKESVTRELEAEHTIDREIEGVTLIYAVLKEIEGEPQETLRGRRFRRIAQTSLFWRLTQLRFQRLVLSVRSWWAS